MVRMLVVAGTVALGAHGAAFGQAFLETFDGGFPAGWSIEDYQVGGSPFTWAPNAAYGAGNWTGGTGVCAMASSLSAPGSYSLALVTPDVVVPAVGGAFRYKVNWQSAAAFDHARVDISTDGGLVWSPLFTHGPDLGAAFSSAPPNVVVTVGLAGFAGETARFRFHYYTDVVTGPVHDLYWQVDDVELIPAPGSGALALLGGLLALRRRR